MHAPDCWPGDARGWWSVACAPQAAMSSPGHTPALVSEPQGVTVEAAVHHEHKAPRIGSNPPGWRPGLIAAGLTWSMGGAGENRLAQARNMSGSGFPFFTSGSSPKTMWSNKLKKSWCLLVFISKEARPELVATARGTPCARRWRTSLSTPAEQEGTP